MLHITAPKPSLAVLISPLDDELISSWLVRLARTNSTRLHSFTTDLLGKMRADGRRHLPTAHWQRDIDRSLKDTDLERIAQRTESLLTTLKQHTLQNLQERVLGTFEKIQA